ncbi:MAG: hypothetical protein KC419_23045, partial [Anaerolineales bacterium]|nr:hypothetical protein [Anaerolineales bacterium]
MIFIRKTAWLFLLALILFASGCRCQRNAYDALLAMMENTVNEAGPGVVLYTNGPQSGEQVFARGVADQERNMAVRTVNHFRIGGLTKAYISTLVLQ